MPLCEVTDPYPCPNPARSKRIRLCENHYRRSLKYDGDPTAGRMIKGIKGKPCLFKGGCTNPIYADGLCRGHHYRLCRYGDPALGSPVIQDAEEVDHRRCIRCCELKPLAEFPPDTNLHKGRKRVCLQCTKERMADYYQDNKERTYEQRALTRILLRYGEAGVEIERRRRAGDPCDVCGRRIEPMSIDHCHDSNVVRGLLCKPCNFALGMVDDDPTRLRALADYLERHQAPCSGSTGFASL